ncbi:MAG TPA: cyclic nucleotide-binding and patatin-like phospholipase domain-containing protein [Acidimicrobiales bacterium]|nr:cyclic nucleotide-binding and patatin-like phospholipase domain-containing protein [Acidimicrobiales bacterium]
MPDTAAEVLRGVDWLSAVPDDRIAEMAHAARIEALPAGSHLYREGDPASDLAVVVSGRLRATGAVDGSITVDREIGRGEPVGELGFLTGDARAASVVAVRDSVVLRLDRAAVDGALTSSPEVGRALVTLVADRLRNPVQPSATPTTIGVLRAPEGGELTTGLDQLVAGLERVGAGVVVPGRQGAPEPRDAAGLGALIDRVEEEGGVLVLPLHGRDPERDDLAGRAVDLLLFDADSAERPSLGAGTRELLARLADAGLTPRRELALRHRRPTAVPSGTPAWAAATGASPVHHVRAGNDRDADRLARHLTGASVGLVLSGGGARAMAHLGAYRALREAGVAIDRVGGSSMGGVVGLQIAAEVPPEELIALDRRELRRADFARRMTLPVVSLLSVRQAVPLFDRLFGDRDISDSWIPAYVTTVDLTDCVAEVRESGPAARWARATASPPGLWPPIVDERGHLVVDGGVLDNLPVHPMRERGAERVIAVNVSARRELAVAGDDAEITSWFDYARRAARRRGAPTFPSVAAVVTRLGVVTSLAAQAAAAAAVDLYVEPDVARFGMVSYRSFDAIVTEGYRAMAAALERGEGWVPGP